MLAHTQRVQVVFVQETCESAAKQSGVRRQEAVGCVLANCAIDGMLLLNLGTKSAGSASASIDGLTASPLLIDMAPTSCCIHTFIADVRLCRAIFCF